MRSAMPDHFKPSSALSAETLKAYVDGRLEADAAHDVELHLEADPLLRDAVEGLRMSGAMAGLPSLASHKPKGSSTTWAAWILTAIVVATAGTVFYFAQRDTAQQASTPQQQEGSAIVLPMDTLAPFTLEAAEIAAAVEIPESLHIGHASTERHALAAASNLITRADSVIRTSIDPVHPRTVVVRDTISKPGAAPARRERTSLQLVYLHDLKLVHPKELYGRSPFVHAMPTGVDARFSSAADQQAAQAQERRMAYLTFMDEALEKFVHNDHRGALEELQFVLDQYPQDVNALFYAGLCCYNLGLNEYAERFFHRAATHPVQVFDEEAEWYHALAMERLGGKSDAQAIFQRIANSGGFYAQRASARLGTH